MNCFKPFSEKEKKEFFAYLKTCISLYLVSTFNDIKQALEEIQKKDNDDFNNSAFMDIVSNEAYKNDLNKTNNKANKKVIFYELIN